MYQILNFQSDQITSSQLAIDSQVEQGKIPGFVGQLQSGTDRPYFFEAQWSLLPYRLTLVPGSCVGLRNVINVHTLVSFMDERNQSMRGSSTVVYRPEVVVGDHLFGSNLNNGFSGQNGTLVQAQNAD